MEAAADIARLNWVQGLGLVGFVAFGGFRAFRALFGVLGFVRLLVLLKGLFEKVFFHGFSAQEIHPEARALSSPAALRRRLWPWLSAFGCPRGDCFKVHGCL